MSFDPKHPQINIFNQHPAVKFRKCRSQLYEEQKWASQFQTTTARTQTELKEQSNNPIQDTTRQLNSLYKTYTYKKHNFTSHERVYVIETFSFNQTIHSKNYVSTNPSSLIQRHLYHVPLVLTTPTISYKLERKDKTNLSHDGINPAHVPF